VAVSSRNAIGCAAHVKADSESSDDRCDMIKTGCHLISVVHAGKFDTVF